MEPSAPPTRPPPGRQLAVDYGRVRLGLATCDELGIAVRPLGFVRRADDAQAAQVVAAMAARERVAGVVVGMPINADGSRGANVRWVEDFLRELRRRCALPLHTVDERYSSVEAEEALREEGRWPCDPGQVDAKAAAILLRRWLDGER